MKNRPEMEGKIIDHAHGLGTVTRDMVTHRAKELAMINGREPNQMLESDWAQAKRELLGDDAPAWPEEGAEGIPVSKRWDPVPGTAGHHVDNVLADDEQTVAERLINQGVAEAEHDQMVEATKDLQTNE